MGFFDWLQDKVLHPVRDFVFDPANVGTAAGFVMGGPFGAGVGRALGNAADRIGEKYLDTGTGLRSADPITFGSTAKNAATGYALGKGAEFVAPKVGSFGRALGFGDDAAAAAVPVGPTAADVAGTPLVASTAEAAPAAPMVGESAVALLPDAGAAAGAGSGGGGFTGALGDFWGGMSGMEKAYLVSQGVGAGADLYGAYQQGQEADRLWEREEEARRARAALVRAFLEDPDRFVF